MSKPNLVTLYEACEEYIQAVDRYNYKNEEGEVDLRLLQKVHDRAEEIQQQFEISSDD